MTALPEGQQLAGPASLAQPMLALPALAAHQLLVWQPQQPQQQHHPQQPQPVQYYPQIAPWFRPNAYAWQPPHQFGPYHVQPPPAAVYVDPTMLLGLLAIPPGLDQAGLRVVEEAGYRIALQQRSRAEQVVQAPQFRDWLVAPGSRELLVSALSLVCATLVQALRARRDYVALAFFCGCHVEDDDGHVGAAAVARSLAAQFLLQRPFGPVVWGGGVDLDGVRRGDVAALCGLLGWLVGRQLPRDQLLVCVVDGAGHYETDELEDDMLAVLRALLRFARTGSSGDAAAHGAVKVLVTNPSATDAVQEMFDMDNEASFLSMSELPQTNQLSSTLRLGRSLHRRVSGADDSDNEEENDEDSGAGDSDDDE